MKNSIMLYINQWRNRMALPREIQLENGTVSLQGFPKEVADVLSEHIRAFGQAKVIIPQGSVLDSLDVPADDFNPTSAPKVEDLPHRALGVYRQDKLNRIVTVAYNLDTKQALVVDVKGAIDNKDASTQFKMAADKLRFV